MVILAISESKYVDIRSFKAIGGISLSEVYPTKIMLYFYSCSCAEFRVFNTILSKALITRNPNEPTYWQTQQELRKKRPKTGGRIFPSDGLFVFSITDGKTDQQKIKGRKTGLAKGRLVLVPVNLIGFPSARPKMIDRFDKKNPTARCWSVRRSVDLLGKKFIFQNQYFINFRT